MHGKECVNSLMYIFAHFIHSSDIELFLSFFYLLGGLVLIKISYSVFVVTFLKRNMSSAQILTNLIN